jgi:hypothetical protein
VIVIEMALCLSVRRVATDLSSLMIFTAGLSVADDEMVGLAQSNAAGSSCADRFDPAARQLLHPYRTVLLA